MSCLPTLLLTRVESLLPRTAAAACITPSRYCVSEVVYRDGVPGRDHRFCNLSCHGKTTGCGGWMSGNCSGV
jgi:hypothetical protein